MSTKDFVLSVFPNKFIWLIGVDVEFVLPCRSDPLGRHGDESEQEALDPVRGLDSKEDGHERQFSVASSSMPRSTVSAFGTRVCGRSVRVSFRYRLRSSMQVPPQQKTEKTARVISLY